MSGSMRNLSCLRCVAEFKFCHESLTNREYSLKVNPHSGVGELLNNNRGSTSCIVLVIILFHIHVLTDTEVLKVEEIHPYYGES